MRNAFIWMNSSNIVLRVCFCLVESETRRCFIFGQSIWPVVVHIAHRRSATRPIKNKSNEFFSGAINGPLAIPFNRNNNYQKWPTLSMRKRSMCIGIVQWHWTVYHLCVVKTSRCSSHTHHIKRSHHINLLHICCCHESRFYSIRFLFFTKNERRTDHVAESGLRMITRCGVMPQDRRCTFFGFEIRLPFERIIYL